ncbi:FkbM family methyltransferase [Paenibacillus hamazuiensis]|uniref:FkbM family methyltransferase n=1 Tax=Paenibacillus hamazuiensis TaxID=2936508 RepID=UPI00200CC023|nr:FkbM family methyltransferase [Paenibacillus hamazuiensis]
MQEDTEAIEKTLKETVIFDGMNGSLLLQLGDICSSQGRFTEARLYYSKALEMSGSSGEKELIKSKILETERRIQTDFTDEEPSTEFLDVLLKEVLHHSANDYVYNIDIELFEFMRVPVRDTIVLNTEAEKRGIRNHLQGIANLYDCLADQASRELLLKVLAFRILGNKKVKLPLNNPEYWRRRQFIKKLICSANTLKTKFHQWDLNHFHLLPLGYNLELYCFPIGLSATFLEKQYVYDKTDPPVKTDPGDIVIDAGGCFGDTALFFADEIGNSGHVYTIEFIPSNLEIMETNLNLNPHLRDKITIVEHPLWNVPNQLLHYKDQGPGSFVSFFKTDQVNEETTTITIDEIVSRYRLSRVDFIKMDIEGAELHALLGAEQTLKRFKPKLAVTIYHQIGDFDNIAKYLNGLDLGYRFYLGHNTIYAQETVLFASSDLRVERETHPN